MVVMLVAMVATAAIMAARAMTAPTLITPADNDDDVVASGMKVSEGTRHARAADARGMMRRGSRPPFQRARKGARMNSTCGAGGPSGRVE
eukprot:6320729-Pyramimonas_sp.AAC.1